jgi:hypothetical protein
MSLETLRHTERIGNNVVASGYYSFSRCRAALLDTLHPVTTAAWSTVPTYTPNSVLRDIETWAGTLEGPGVFWLNGLAGTGKSTIAATACQYLDKKQLLGACFFIRREQADLRNASNIVCSIAHQLAMRSDLVAEGLCAKLRDRPASYPRTVQEQITDFIIEPARALDEQSMHCIVIDALDDCFLDTREQPGGKLLLILCRQLLSLSGRLKLFFTTCDELATRIRIQQEFNETAQLQKGMRIHDLEIISDLPGEQD